VPTLELRAIGECCLAGAWRRSLRFGRLHAGVQERSFCRCWMLAIASEDNSGLSGATSWAAAVIVEIGLLTAMSAALAVASPGTWESAVPHRLGHPAILGAAGCIWSRSDHGTHVVVRLPQRGALAITVGLWPRIARWIASLGRIMESLGDERRRSQSRPNRAAVLHDGGLTIASSGAIPPSSTT